MTADITSGAAGGPTGLRPPREPKCYFTSFPGTGQVFRYVQSLKPSASRSGSDGIATRETGDLGAMLAELTQQKLSLLAGQDRGGPGGAVKSTAEPSAPASAARVAARGGGLALEGRDITCRQAA